MNFVRYGTFRKGTAANPETGEIKSLVGLGASLQSYAPVLVDGEEGPYWDTTLYGSDRADYIAFKLTVGTATYTTSGITRIDARGGNDLVDLTSSTGDYDVAVRIDAGGGDDTVWAGPHDDTIRGDAGRDNLWGGRGDDLIYGGDGVIDLRDGRDRIDGADGNDTLYGNAGHDDIFGGSGNDWLIGGKGNDDLDGGDGASDRAIYLGPSSAYQVNQLGNGAYQVIDQFTLIANEGVDTLVDVEYIQFLGSFQLLTVEEADALL